MIRAKAEARKSQEKEAMARCSRLLRRNDEIALGRPSLALREDQIIKLVEHFGLHPNLEPVAELWRARDLAIVHGVGYPRPNRPHFRSIDIWNTGADSNEYLTDGWIARLYKERPALRHGPVDGVVLATDALVGPMSGDQFRAVVMEPPRQLDRAAERVSADVKGRVRQHLVEVENTLADASSVLRQAYQSTDVGLGDVKGLFANQLKETARLITGGAEVPILKCHSGRSIRMSGKLGHTATAWRNWALPWPLFAQP
jgi:uncharacterized protein (DUF1501 family)